MENPFTPGFGDYPAVRAGRTSILQKLRRGLHPSVRSHPARRLLLLGDRGVGKTVLLDDAHDVAVGFGWRVAEVAGPGVTTLSQRVIDEVWSPTPNRSSTSVRLGAGPVRVEHTWTPPHAHAPRSAREALSTMLASDDAPTGVLVTIDEIHDVDRAELKIFGNDMQLLVRSGFPVAFVGAGLSGHLELDDPDKVSTFISRADVDPDLDLVDDTDLQIAFVETLATVDLPISPEVASVVAQRSGGLPYAMQVLGWHLVERCASAQQITLDDVAAVLPESHERIRTGLQLRYDAAPSLRRFMAAMSGPASPVPMRLVTRALQRTNQQVSPLRARLIEDGYIAAGQRGFVEFTAAGYRAVVATDPTMQQEVTAGYRHGRAHVDEQRSIPNRGVPSADDFG